MRRGVHLHEQQRFVHARVGEVLQDPAQVSGLPMQAPPALTISSIGTVCACLRPSMNCFMKNSYERGGLPSIQGAKRLRTASL